MRIERAEHPVDRALDQHVVAHRLDIARLDALVDCQKLGELRTGAAIDLREAGGGGRDERERADEGGAAGQGAKVHGGG